MRCARAHLFTRTSHKDTCYVTGLFHFSDSAEELSNTKSTRRKTQTTDRKIEERRKKNNKIELQLNIVVRVRTYILHTMERKTTGKNRYTSRVYETIIQIVIAYARVSMCSTVNSTFCCAFSAHARKIQAMNPLAFCSMNEIAV